MLPKLTIILGLAAIATAMCGVFFANRGIVSANAGLGLYALSAVIGLIAVICATAALFLTTRYGAVMVGMLGALPLIAVVSAGVSGLQYPRLNDVTTDLDNPPQFVAAAALPANAGRDMAYPADFVPLVRESYSMVQPVVLDVGADTAYKRAVELGRVQLGWTIVAENPEEHRFEALDRTRTFHWTDDIVVRITPQGAEESRVDVRSKSRDGKSDFGVNAARIQYFLGELKALNN